MLPFEQPLGFALVRIAPPKFPGRVSLVGLVSVLPAVPGACLIDHIAHVADDVVLRPEAERHADPKRSRRHHRAH